MDNNLITRLFTQINKLIDNKLNNLTQIKSATVHSVNQNGTVNLFIPPDKTIYHNIQNQSIYRNLQPGDYVKIIIENGNLSNMWIIGGFGLQTEIYPIGSIYIATNNVNPTILFGGKWQQINDRFLLASGNTFQLGTTGGEKEHTLTVDEMPRHTHSNKYQTNNSQTDWGYVYSNYGYNSKVTPESGGIGYTGNNQAHNNMPPYLVVYMWTRVA